MDSESGPLLYEDLHQKVKEIQPSIFDGIRLGLNKPLTPHLQLTHSIVMGMMNSHYKFGANYMGTKQISPMESYPVLASDIQCDGQMNANLIHLLNPRTKIRLVGSFARNKCAGSQATLDYKGDNFTTTLTAANIDLVRNDGIIIGQLLHRFSKSVSLGPEFLLQYATKDSMLRTNTQVSIGGRYDAENYCVDATLSAGGAHITFHRKANENLQFGAEFLTDRSIRQSNAGFYYQYNLSKSHTKFRGSIDTAWNVGGLIEKTFFPLPIVFSISAFLCHPKNSTTLGVGLTVG